VKCPGIDALPMLNPFAAVTRFVSFTLTGSEVTNKGAAAGQGKFPLQIERPVSRIWIAQWQVSGNRFQ
jgi:hypothetical protein